MTDFIVKQYEFKLAEGGSREQLIAASAKLDAFLLSLDGFEYRSLAELDDGTWLDINYWSSPEEANQDELLMQQPFMAEFMSNIDGASVTCKRAVVATQSYTQACDETA